jgi:hypothetical protein
MQGEALQLRIHDAMETAFVEVDTVKGEFDPTEYINYIVGNILTGLCFGGKYVFYLTIYYTYLNIHFTLSMRLFKMAACSFTLYNIKSLVRLWRWLHRQCRSRPVATFCTTSYLIDNLKRELHTF